ncbi:E3 ubiquitin-protein ligase TRIM71-like [Anneissia japonica]|uniref:E3 ubiquitin-protein ligase TRIM71-like n=1 Tax=Anneissia japonica TaxID=1529436 RepID=UPI001425BA6A|nr:E3 ubiquitin-protein ligase TRIM71-like [Anneissia japonica]XP_033122410.1 E3 ubiquitin-protein ligase TRIM71-like [Anneissia japonica]XP_033122418.1 E3 ubiquitin-protein ligase TRIM71-like [Anneissia japonica]
MSVSKALQFMDKKDLECAICLNRFHQPKTLKCTHTYCLQCIQKWVETHEEMKCPTCKQEHDLTKEDLNKLASNTKISQLLEYVMKTEDQKPTKCSCCDNQPAYHCLTCQLFLCGSQCVKQHKMIPSTKDHPLYTLDIKEPDGQPTNCQVHCNTPLEFYCSNCNKSACKRCEHILRCYQKQHEVIPMSTAIEEFNKNATELVKLAQEIENKLTEKLEFIDKNKSLSKSQLKLSRTAIEIQENKLIKKVKEKSKELTLKLEKIHKEEEDAIDSKFKDIDSKRTQLNNLMAKVNKMMNKPEEREALGSHTTTINTVRDKVLATDFDKSFDKINMTPKFIPCTHLDELMNTEGIGKIITADMTYEVADDDKEITVPKGQPFVVKVSSLSESDACQLAATLINSSGEESPTDVEYDGNGQYTITGRCNVEGDWQMKITARDEHIKGSPVNIKVEKLGLVHTIDNISDYKEHNKEFKVTDLVLNRDGCILVSSRSKYILKFNQLGSFVARIQVPQIVAINRMHLMSDGHMIYSDAIAKCVVLCDENFQEVRSFGKGMFKFPFGLTLNKETRALYVADNNAHCVYKFNVDDGRLLGEIGSEGSEVGQMMYPQDVILTKEGHVVVADFGNERIQMFDANDKFMRIIVGTGKKDGKVWGPHGVTMDMDENIIVSSNHKLQLFDKNGVFLARIDHKDDELDSPLGITVISNRPRRVAVANHRPNNVKIFNY